MSFVLICLLPTDKINLQPIKIYDDYVDDEMSIGLNAHG